MQVPSHRTWQPASRGITTHLSDLANTMLTAVLPGPAVGSSIGPEILRRLLDFALALALAAHALATGPGGLRLASEGAEALIDARVQAARDLLVIQLVRQTCGGDAALGNRFQAVACGNQPLDAVRVHGLLHGVVLLAALRTERARLRARAERQLGARTGLSARTKAQRVHNRHVATRRALGAVRALRRAVDLAAVHVLAEHALVEGLVVLQRADDGAEVLDDAHLRAVQHCLVAQLVRAACDRELALSSRPQAMSGGDLHLGAASVLDLQHGVVQLAAPHAELALRAARADSPPRDQDEAARTEGERA